MSENLFALLASCAIVLLLVLWTPFLHLVCPPCSRLLRHTRRRPPVTPAGLADDQTRHADAA